MVCGGPLTIEFIPGQMHMREALQTLHSNNLEWFRGKFPGCRGTMLTNARAKSSWRSTLRTLRAPMSKL